MSVDFVPQKEKPLALVDTGSTHQVELRLPGRPAIPGKELP